LPIAVAGEANVPEADLQLLDCIGLELVNGAKDKVLIPWAESIRAESEFLIQFYQETLLGL
jgi:hypothetical protein